QVAHAADGHSTLDPLVGSGDPDRRGTAAGDAGDGDAVGVDVGTTHEIVDATDAVPALDAGRRVTERLPPPAAVAISAVVNARDLAELQRVDDQADVTVRGEPHAVILKGGLVAVPAAPRVTAHIEHCGKFAGCLLRTIEVAGDIEAGPALVVQFL